MLRLKELTLGVSRRLEWMLAALEGFDFCNDLDARLAAALYHERLMELRRGMVEEDGVWRCIQALWRLLCKLLEHGSSLSEFTGGRTTEVPRHGKLNEQ